MTHITKTTPAVAELLEICLCIDRKYAPDDLVTRIGILRAAATAFLAFYEQVELVSSINEIMDKNSDPDYDPEQLELRSDGSIRYRDTFTDSTLGIVKAEDLPAILEALKAGKSCDALLGVPNRPTPPTRDDGEVSIGDKKVGGKVKP
jgi:hypothetical protein